MASLLDVFADMADPRVEQGEMQTPIDFLVIWLFATVWETGTKAGRTIIGTVHFFLLEFFYPSEK